MIVGLFGGEWCGSVFELVVQGVVVVDCFDVVELDVLVGGDYVGKFDVVGVVQVQMGVVFDLFGVCWLGIVEYQVGVEEFGGVGEYGVVQVGVEIVDGGV